MRRFSIAALMVVVLISGVAVAALKDASEAWAGLLLCMTLLLLGVSIVGAIYRREAARAFWVGFAVFGGSYLLIQNVPKLWDQAAEPLPTGRFLAYVHAKLHPDRSRGERVQLARWAFANQDRSSLRQTIVSDGADSTVRLWKFTLEGNLDQFVRVGHCLFALVAALLGGFVAVWFHRTNHAAAPSPA